MSVNDPLDRLTEPEQRFTQMYLDGRPPWDSGVSPPELLVAIQGPAALLPGRALDVGCGTGTNSLTLALSGWQVVGVDFAAPAIAQAQAKGAAVHAQLQAVGGTVTFLQGDVTQLAAPAPTEQMLLILDIGCLNGIPRDLRPAYASVMAEQAAPGAVFLLYAHLPHADGSGPIGCTPEELDTLLEGAFLLEKREMGQAPQGGASMWNWLRRRAQ